jgi:hypothetical protein
VSAHTLPPCSAPQRRALACMGCQLHIYRLLRVFNSSTVLFILCTPYQTDRAPLPSRRSVKAFRLERLLVIHGLSPDLTSSVVATPLVVQCTARDDRIKKGSQYLPLDLPCRHVPCRMGYSLDQRRLYGNTQAVTLTTDQLENRELLTRNFNFKFPSSAVFS